MAGQSKPWCKNVLLKAFRGRNQRKLWCKRGENGATVLEALPRKRRLSQLWCHMCVNPKENSPYVIYFCFEIARVDDNTKVEVGELHKIFRFYVELGGIENKEKFL